MQVRKDVASIAPIERKIVGVINANVILVSGIRI